MKKFLVTTAAVALSTFALASNAQDLKIGIVDMGQVLQKSPLMVSLNSDLTKKFQSRQNEINEATTKLQEEASQFDLKSGSMSQDDRTKIQNKLITERANVQILTASFQRDLAIAKDEAMRNFTTKLTQVINRLAQDENYDMIQQRTDIPFVNSNLDITKKIIDKMS